MECDSTKTLASSTEAKADTVDKLERPQYVVPAMYVIGRSQDLMQGSGRHKNDDTGSRGFTVDQR